MATSPDQIVLYIMIALVVFFVILAIIFNVFKPVPITTPASFYLSQYDNIGAWGGNVLSNDPTRNICRLYQFEGKVAEVNFGQGLTTTAIPASPSLDPAILDTLNPEGLKSCYDMDQIAAAQVTHTCVTIADFQSGNLVTTDAQGNSGVSFCIAADGGRVAIGSSETYYTQTTTLFNSAGETTSKLTCDNTACSGILSLMAFNYIPGGPDDIYEAALCLKTDINGTNFAGAVCDLGDQTQLVRITRAGAPASGSDGQEQTTSGRFGVLASLFFRLAGSYIVPNPTRTGLDLGTDGTKVWALVPQLVGLTLIGPQQIVFVGDLNAVQQSQFNAVLSADALLTLIIGNNLQSIQLNDITNKQLVLQPYQTYPVGTDPTEGDFLATFMYVNYNLFGPILLTTAASAF